MKYWIARANRTTLSGHFQHRSVNECVCVCVCGGGQVAERLGNRTIIQKVVGSIPGHANDVVSLGNALHPTCRGGNVNLLTVSRYG